MGLGFELWAAFRLEAKHGFNKQTVSIFFSDKLKSLALQAVIGVPILSAVLHVIKARFLNMYARF